MNDGKADQRLMCRAEKCRPDKYGGRRRALPTIALCGPCASHVADNFAALASLWPDLADELVRTGEQVERVSGTPAHGLVLDEHVSDVIAEVQGWAAFLVRTVVDERGLAAWPVHTRDRLAWLGSKHARWFTHHTDADLAVSVCDDARAYASKVRQAVQPGQTRRFAVGPCPNHTTRPAPVDDDRGAGQQPGAGPRTDRGGGSKSEASPGGNRGEGVGACQADARRYSEPEAGDDGEARVPAYPCPGTLYAVLRDHTDTLPSHLACDHDPEHTYEPRRWLSLGRKLRAAS